MFRKLGIIAENFGYIHNISSYIDLQDTLELFIIKPVINNDGDVIFSIIEEKVIIQNRSGSIFCTGDTNTETFKKFISYVEENM